MEVNRGSSSIVVIDDKNKNIVTKCSKKNISLQYEIHRISYNIVNNKKYIFLKIPKLISKETKKYSMERINDSNLLLFSKMNMQELNKYSNFIYELKDFYKEMMKINIFPNDFELYEQIDNSIYLLDFDKFFPYIPNNYKSFLIHPALPKDFLI